MMNIFVSIGNVRTGSTHLMTSLDRLNDVSCDYELKWIPKYKKQDVHIFLQPGDSIKKTIVSYCPVNKNCGTKFIFDPYIGSIILSNDVEHVLNLFEPELSIIHVIRSYFKIFISMFARGGVHVSNNNNVQINSVLGQNVESNENEVAQRKIEFNKHQCLIIFLNLFHNDLICLDICRRVNKYLTIDYSRINSHFKEIAQFVGSFEPEKIIQKIIKEPFLKKLSPIDLNMVPHMEFCKFISNILYDALLDEIKLLNKRKKSKHPVNFFLNNNEVMVQLSPELTDYLSPVIAGK